MLKIRKRQRAALAEEALREFEDRMVTHLRRVFPANCDVLGEPAVRRVIRYGLIQAGTYGIIAERGVCIFVDAMFAFGKRFDARSPGLEDSTDKKFKSPIARADALFDTAFDNISEARGIRLEELDE